MNEKEISELRRRYKLEKNNITSIRGCYVNEKQEILSQFNESLALMQDSEAEKILAILKKTLSGSHRKNLIDIEFTTQQVADGEKHKLLMTMRESKLENDEAVNEFFQQVITSVSLEENYVILLAHDIYDVPFKSINGDNEDEHSSEVFSYIICSICPVKPSKPALSYYVKENEFHSSTTDRIVSPPELGFMFPAFDDRSTNIYNALYYTKNTKLSYDDFADSVFDCEIPMPATEQKEVFKDILSDTFGEECSLDVVQSVHGKLQKMIEVHKESKEETPLTVYKGTVKHLLNEAGASDEQLESFDEQYNQHFGEDTALSPKNIIDISRTELKTPDVTIRVSPGCDNLVKTRMIDGSKYIMIRAEDGVEINGVPINITE